MSDDVKGLGQSLLHRASAPGVIRHDFAAQHSFNGGAWLAGEIHRRYAPGASFWGHGSGLPYPGFGFGFGAASVNFAVEPGAKGYLKSEPPRVPALTPGPSPNRTPAPPGEGRAVTSQPKNPSSPLLSLSSSSTAKMFAQSSLPSPGGPGVRPGEGPGVRAEGRGAPPTELPGHPQPALLPSGVEAGPAIVRRATARPHLPGPPLPEGRPQAGVAMGEGTGVRPFEMQPAIVHRSAGHSAVQRTSLKSARSEPVQAQRSTLSRSEVGAAELHTLPLTQPARLQPKAPAAETGIDLPLARSAQPAGVIQRQPAETLSDVLSPQAIELDDEGSPANDEAAAPGGTTAAPGLDLEDVVDRVMRRLTRTLTVESERHGGRRWN